MAQERQATPFDLAAELSLTAFKTGLDFWAKWPFLMVPTEAKADEIKPAPATPEAISVATKATVPPSIKAEFAPMIVAPAVAPVPQATSNWKPKESRKKAVKKPASKRKR